jgi:Asp-tRNA(Asn)/Glu-tRNA(Gln) amidotransferase C subunit
VQEEAMAWSKEERIQELARLVGITIAPEEEAEVANRFESLIQELARLAELDLADIEPVTIFPEEA